MNKLSLLIGTFLLLSSASGLELQKGIPKPELSIDDPIVLELMRAGAIGMDSYFDIQERNEYVVLLSSRLFRFNYDFSVEDDWPLTRWEHDHYYPEEVVNRYESYRMSADFVRELSTGGRTLGCLPQKPLRYGDINGNGHSELVIWFSNDILIFSPDTEAVIFSQPMRIDDWLDKEETLNRYEDIFWGEIPDDAGQYMSKISASAVPSGGLLNYGLPGYRGYGKLFLGDFTSDGQHDILVWHKLYQSLTRASDQSGFEHLQDTLLHYQLVEGEYQPIETDEATIRGWLEEQDLTWQQGYPRYSECEGEEGQLIPEMHDPLLNDPEVLE